MIEPIAQRQEEKHRTEIKGDVSHLEKSRSITSRTRKGTEARRGEKSNQERIEDLHQGSGQLQVWTVN